MIHQNIALSNLASLHVPCLAPASHYSCYSLDIDTTLPAPALIADAVKRSSKAHIFHFYGIFCDIASFPKKTPTAWIIPDTPRHSRWTSSEGAPEEGSPDQFPVGVVGAKPPAGQSLAAVEFDARDLSKACLKEIGKEMGAEI